MMVEEYPLIKPCNDDEEINELKKALDSMWLLDGPKVNEFENALGEFIGAELTAAVSSCTAGIHSTLKALGIGEGNEIIVPAFCFPSDATMPKLVGAEPIFVDVDYETHMMDPNKVEKAITERTRAIICADYCGLPTDLDPLLSLAEEHNLHIIQDAATSFGAEYKENKVGGVPGITTVFSFGPVKMITTGGKGGAICTDNQRIIDEIPTLRSYGMDKTMYERQENENTWYYDINELGHNYRMTDIGAAMGLAQLRKAPDFIKKRRELANHYDKLLQDIDALAVPPNPDPYERAYLYYPIKLNSQDFPLERDEYGIRLKKKGIGVSVHWAKPMYLNDVFDNANHERGDFPVTDRLANEVLSLPMYPQLEKTDLEKIVETMKDVIP
jgi:dTDP-4-amino-4,6-dideoxygalactose transaminase